MNKTQGQTPVSTHGQPIRNLPLKEKSTYTPNSNERQPRAVTNAPSSSSTVITSKGFVGNSGSTITKPRQQVSVNTSQNLPTHSQSQSLLQSRSTQQQHVEPQNKNNSIHETPSNSIRRIQSQSEIQQQQQPKTNGNNNNNNNINNNNNNLTSPQKSSLVIETNEHHNEDEKQQQQKYDEKELEEEGEEDKQNLDNEEEDEIPTHAFEGVDEDDPIIQQQIKENDNSDQLIIDNRQLDDTRFFAEQDYYGINIDEEERRKEEEKLMRLDTAFQLNLTYSKYPLLIQINSCLLLLALIFYFWTALSLNISASTVSVIFMTFGVIGWWYIIYRSDKTRKKVIDERSQLKNQSSSDTAFWQTLLATVLANRVIHYLVIIVILLISMFLVLPNIAFSNMFAQLSSLPSNSQAQFCLIFIFSVTSVIIMIFLSIQELRESKQIYTGNHTWIKQIKLRKEENRLIQEKQNKLEQDRLRDDE